MKNIEQNRRDQIKRIDKIEKVEHAKKNIE